MSRLVAICLPLAFWLGAALGPTPGALYIALGALLVAGVWRGPPGVLLAAAAGGVLCGIGEHHWRDALPVEPPPTPTYATVRAVSLAGGTVDVRLAPDGAPAHGATLRLARRPAGLAPGARVRAVGRWRPLAPADEPGGWDAAARGARDGVAWRARGALDVVTPAPGYAAWSIRAREAARRRLAASRRPYGAALLTGLLLGDRAAVPESARDALQATGTGHLLAVSGLHVGGLALVVGGFGLALARRWPAVHTHRWAAALAAPAVLGFVTLAQFPLSACRAGLMVGLYLVGRGLGRRPDGVILLGWAAVILLADGPAGAAGAGFQLSFGAVGALLWLATGPASAGAAPADGISRAARRLRLATSTAVIAAAATAPVEAWHFGTVAPLAPLANLLLCPLAAMVLVPLGLVGLALAPLTGLPLDVAAAGAEGLTALAEVFAGWGGSWIVGRAMAPAAAIPLAVLVLLRMGRPRAASAGALLLAGIAAIARPAGGAVDFLPVGQGDAVLVRSAGHAMLVDAGPDPTGFRLLGALRRAGIDRLDAVFVSHAHPDHFAGLSALVDRVDIGAVWFNGRRGGRSWQAMARRLTARGVPLRRARPGRFSVGGLAVSVLVGGPRPSEPLSENDASLVLRVDGPAASVLLTGDLEAAGEARLLAEAPRPVTVLKAPHHGSRTSSGPALLDRLCPAAVVHTVGRHNRFGLPHPAVLARYAAADIDNHRTDRDGRVTLDLDVGSIGAHRRARRRLPPAGCRLSRWRTAALRGADMREKQTVRRPHR